MREGDAGFRGIRRRARHAARGNPMPPRRMWRCIAGWSVVAGLWLATTPLGATVYLEDSPAATELADEAASLYRQGRLGEAAQQLQRLIDEFPQKLMPQSRRVASPAAADPVDADGGGDEGGGGGGEGVADPGEIGEAAAEPEGAPGNQDENGGGRDGGEVGGRGGGVVYTDASRWVVDQLRSDAALREAYRQRFGVEAERLLEQALTGPPGGEAGRGGPADAGVAGVAARFAMTRAGLEAGLVLAGRHLLWGDAASAARRLDELIDHPDAATEGVSIRLAELRAWTLAMQGNTAAASQMLDEAEALRDTSTNEDLRDTLARLRRPGGDGLAELNEQDVGSDFVPPPLERPLWQATLEADKDEPRRRLQPRTSNTAGSQTDGPAELRPVAADGLLLIHDESSVVAMDQVSGRQRWRHEAAAEARSEVPQGFGRAAVSRLLADERTVAVDRDGVYAVLGDTPLARVRNRFGADRVNRLVRLDLATGRAVWSLTTDDLEEGLQSVSFHGTPVVSGDRVVVMARRSQASSFQDSYLLAVDAATGRVVWRRHLASSSVPNRGNGLAALSQMTLVGGTVYFCDNLGVAAAVDAQRGVVRWVRVLADRGQGPNAGEGGMGAGGEAGGFGDPWGNQGGWAGRGGQAEIEVLPFSTQSRPQLVKAGLVLPVQVGAARGLVLDPADGSVRQRLTHRSPIATAYEVQAVGGDLLVIGERLQRLDGSDLTTIWQEAPPIGGRRGAEAYPKATRVGQRLLVAREAGSPLRELDWRSGEVLAERRLARAGRVVLANGAWVVADERRLSSYLDWSTAYAAIRQRASAEPGAIQPGLSMALLAANAGRGDAVREGVDRAMAALAQPGDSLRGPEAGAWEAKRRQVFVTLIGLAQHPAELDAAVVERLFDRLATTMQRPDELVTYHLERGAFYERQGRPADAVAAYQQVLLDESDSFYATTPAGPGSAPVDPPDNGLLPGDPDAGASANVEVEVRRGGFVARQRLVQLVQQWGRGVYARFDRQAEEELVGLLAMAGTQSDDLLAIGRRYPLAGVVAEATLRAARLQLSSDRPGAAVVSLRQAFHLAQEDAVRAGAAVELAEFYLSRGGVDQARRWLDQVQREQPGLMLDAGGEAVSVDDYRSGRLDAAGRDLDGLDRGGRWSGLGEPVRLEGSLVRYWETSRGPGSDSTLLLTPRGQPRQLMLYEIESGKTRWRIVAPNPDLRLVHLGEDSVLLWSPTTSRLHGLDAATGQALWPAVSPELLLNELTGGVLAELRRTHAGTILSEIEADFGPIVRPQDAAQLGQAEDPLGLRIVADEAVVTIVAGDGRAAGIDRYTGQVLWQWTVAVDRVTHVQVAGGAVAIAGLAAPGTESQASRVLMIDAVTGRSQFSAVEDAQPVSHLQPTVDGDLLVVSGASVRRLSRADGSTRWRIEVGGFSGEPMVSQAGTGFYLLDDRRVMSIDLESGAVAYDGPHQLDRGLQMVGDGRWVSVGNETCQVVDQQLNLVWRDAIYAETKRLVQHAAVGAHVVVAALPESSPRGRLTLYVLEADGGRLVDQIQLAGLLPNPIPERIDRLRGRLLLQGRDWIVLLPSAGGLASPPRPQ